MSSLRDWDSATYDRVSDPMAGWGVNVLDRLRLAGDERALDLGCGTGRVTAELARRLPGGHVTGVDAAPSMIDTARRGLDPRIDFVVADVCEFLFDPPADVILSTAAFHWILDHDRLFERLSMLLKPGGRLEAQCGGEGNIAIFLAVANSIAARPQYRDFFESWNGPWKFASPSETIDRLEANGFAEIRCWLQPAPVQPDEPADYLRSVCLRAHIDRLPTELRGEFIDDVLGATQDSPIIDFVRLNISAVKLAD